MLKCSACNNVMTEDSFYRNACQKSGYSNQCKSCFKESNKRSRAAHPESVRRNRIAYIKRNPEKISEYRRRAYVKRRALFPELFRDKGLATYYEEHQNQPCFYVVGIAPLGAGPVKIGHTRNLQHRARTIQVFSPVPLTVLLVKNTDTKDEALALERSARRALKESRLHGEWFSPTPDVLAWLKSLD